MWQSYVMSYPNKVIISNYLNGELDGEYFEYEEDINVGKGKLLLKANYQNGELAGEWELIGYYKREKGNYFINEKNISVKDGEWLIYSDGVLKEKSIYDKGEKLKYFNYKNGKIDYEVDFENGSTINYYENGKIKAEKLEKFNVYHAINYYENGNLKSDEYSNYVSGVGYYKSFFENGQLKVSNTNEDYIEYYENGQLMEKGSFSPNDFQSKVKTGIWESFYENGQLKEKNQFDFRGINIGWGESYFENGLLKEKIFYSNIEN